MFFFLRWLRAMGAVRIIGAKGVMGMTVSFFFRLAGCKGIKGFKGEFLNPIC